MVTEVTNEKLLEKSTEFIAEFETLEKELDQSLREQNFVAQTPQHLMARVKDVRFLEGQLDTKKCYRIIDAGGRFLILLTGGAVIASQEHERQKHEPFF